MKNILLLIALVSLSGSCNSTKPSAQQAYVQLTKKRCLGECPVYDLFIYQNGSAVYNGIANVSKKGKHEFRLSSSELDAIEALFKASSFNMFEGENIKKVRDFPSTELRYFDKKVSFYGKKIPVEIEKIISYLEELINAK